MHGDQLFYPRHMNTTLFYLFIFYLQVRGNGKSPSYCLTCMVGYNDVSIDIITVPKCNMPVQISNQFNYNYILINICVRFKDTLHNSRSITFFQSSRTKNFVPGHFKDFKDAQQPCFKIPAGRSGFRPRGHLSQGAPPSKQKLN